MADPIAASGLREMAASQDKRSPSGPLLIMGILQRLLEGKHFAEGMNPPASNEEVVELRRIVTAMGDSSEGIVIIRACP